MILLSRQDHEEPADGNLQQAFGSLLAFAILTTFGLSPTTYTLTQLRYDIRKMKAHGLLERDGRRYCYRLTEKGAKVALMMTLFHSRVCGPLANSLFHHRPDAGCKPPSKFETAYHRADRAVQRVVDLLAAA